MGHTLWQFACFCMVTTQELDILGVMTMDMNNLAWKVARTGVKYLERKNSHLHC